MIAKVFVFLAAVAAVRAIGIAGIGAPVLAAGPLGTISAQRTAINHIAPAAPLAVGHGIAAAPVAYGLGAAPWAVGHGLAAGNLLGGWGYGGDLGLGYGAGIAKGIW